MPERPIEKALAEALGAISRVEGVYLISRGDILSVFTLIDNDDEETYDLIYNQERSLIHMFSAVCFDFNAIARRGRPVSEIMGDARPIWQSESAGPCLIETNI